MSQKSGHHKKSGIEPTKGEGGTMKIGTKIKEVQSQERWDPHRGRDFLAVTHPSPCPGVQVTVGEDDVAGSCEV